MKPNDALIRATVVQESEQSERLAAATHSDVAQQRMAEQIPGSFPPALTQAEAIAAHAVTSGTLLPDSEQAERDEYVADADVRY